MFLEFRFTAALLLLVTEMSLWAHLITAASVVSRWLKHKPWKSCSVMVNDSKHSKGLTGQRSVHVLRNSLSIEEETPGKPGLLISATGQSTPRVTSSCSTIG
jgi:hypothetical protein